MKYLKTFENFSEYKSPDISPDECQKMAEEIRNGTVRLTVDEEYGLTHSFNIKMADYGGYISDDDPRINPSLLSQIASDVENGKFFGIASVPGEDLNIDWEIEWDI